MKIRPSRSLAASRRVALLLSGAALASLPQLAPAQAQNWTGAVSNDWLAAGNWSTNTVPDAGHDVTLGTISPNATAISTGNAASKILYIGVGGAAGLTISNGRTLVSSSGSIGYDPGFSSTVTVIGAHSKWATTGNIDVGYQGTASLLVLGSGTLTSGEANVGYDANAIGSARVDGTGSTWTTGQLTVAYGSTNSTLLISGGGIVHETGVSTVGSLAGSKGTITVDGIGSQFKTDGELDIGLNGAGSVNASHDAAVTANSTFVGGFGAADGKLSITDAGTTWNTGVLSIGHRAAGFMDIAAGGSMTDTVASIADTDPNSSGIVIVEDAHSSWTTSGNLTVGTQGTATLTIKNGGFVSNALGIIGGQQGSNGTVTVDGAGSKWANAANVSVGQSGTGTLMIQNGGAVTDTYGTIGDLAHSNGTAIVTGANSSWTNTGSIVVGNLGTGTFTISAGGSVTNSEGSIGYGVGSVGTATVTGAGSTWTQSGEFAVGNHGAGELDILDGGAVTDNIGLVGEFSDGSGKVLVSGAGSLWTNAGLGIGDGGTGELTISDGGSVVSAVGFIGAPAGSVGNVTVTGAGSNWTSGQEFIIGYDGNGTLTLSDDGALSAASGASVAMLSGSVGVLNIGAAASSPAAAPGVVDAPTVGFGPGTGTIVFNHTSSGYDFAPTISGFGTIDQIAGTTVLSADSSAFTGPTSITGGRLAVNGSLSGSVVTVSGGGVLGGNGTVGGVMAAGGGIVGPGNSIGTLHVAGDVAFAAGSTYQVEANDAGQADAIIATGAASLTGGTVAVLAAAGNYAASTQYTVLSAAGGVTGAFDGVTSNLAFLAPSLSYDADDVVLTLARNITSFPAVGLTPNEIAAAGGTEALGAGNPVYDAVLQLDAPSARAAFDSLSGEIHASAEGVLVDDSHFLQDAALDRIRSAFGDVGAAQMSVMALPPEITGGGSGATADASTRAGPALAYADAAATPVAAAATADRFALWGQGFGAWGRSGSDGNAAGLTHSTGGFLIGGDAPVFDNGSSRWRLGLLAGYSRTSFDIDARSSSGDSDNYHLGLYGGSQWGPIGLRFGAAYTWHDIDTDRSVAFPGFVDKLKADYDARTAQAFGELGYRIDVAPSGTLRTAFEPFAGLGYVNLNTDGFTETGAAAALTTRADTMATTFTTLGLHASTMFTINGMNATARGTLGWRHAFGDTTPDEASAFAAGTPFTIAGVPIATDALLLEAGLDINLTPTATLGLTYSGQIADKAQDHSAKGTLNVRF